VVVGLYAFATILTYVSTSGMISSDPEGVGRLFSDVEGGSGFLQLFCVQFLVYTALLQGLVVYPPVMLAALLPTPIVVAAVIRRRR
jgi:hypothetical protein